MSLNETKQQQKKSALVKIISDICTNVVHYRASAWHFVNHYAALPVQFLC